jgi:cathepsin L
VFQNNLDYIDAYNALDNGVTLRMNQFGDLLSNEFRTMYLGYKAAVTADSSFSRTAPSTPAVSYPTNLDWRSSGAVTAVKDQKQCGSCWSFSTTGSTEGCHKIATGSLVSLSEQNLIDCSSNTKYGNHGCNGGLMTSAMKYIIDNGGVDTEASYPYTASQGTCHYSAANKAATLKSYINVKKGDENDLQAHVNLGPTSVAIDASQSSFQFYSSGVYYEPKCSSSSLDHGVLAVGWGVDNGSEYWLVKNSWGTTWGLQGYIEMARNKNNNCGIATQATRPTC